MITDYFSTTRRAERHPKTMNKTIQLAVLATSALAISAVIAGCATGGSGSSGSGSTGTSHVGGVPGVTGKVFGGQQPVAGGTVQLYEATTSGLKNASVALGASTQTSSSGTFSLGYTCPVNNPSVNLYLLSTGGNPGLNGNSVNNTHLSLMAALGPCNTISLLYSTVQVNELSTVAAVYSLAGFMADGTHIGASAGNLTGLNNAFQTSSNLVSLNSGGAPGASLPASSTFSIAELNTLANIIASCVNTDGIDGTGGNPSQCQSLISATTAGTSVPTDTITALLNIVHNPGNQVTPVFNLASSTPPFQPILTQAPKDWTLALTSTGGGLAGPSALAVDASGNIWVANSSGNTVTKLSNTQAQLSGSNGFANTGVLGPQGVAIDTNGNAWLANSYGGSVVEITPTGGLLSPTGGYKLGGITSPQAIAIDNANNVWVTNFDSSTVSGLNASTATVTAISGSPFTAGGVLNLPAGLAIDANANVWISSSGNSAVAEVASTGAPLSGSAGFSDGFLLDPVGVAIDSSARTLVAASGSSDISIFSSTGVASAPVTGSALLQPAGVAVDSSNMIYASNSNSSGSLSLIAAPGAVPIAVGTLDTPVGVAVDASGNVWTANAGNNTVTEFIGLGAPVKTPLATRFGAF